MESGNKIKNASLLSLCIFTVLLFVGCASSSVNRIGSETFAPLPETSPVLIFSNETEINKPYATIGIISYTNPGKYQISTIGDAIPDLQTKARSIGANGVIIDQAIPIKSGVISTGISLKARAILIFENPTPK
jgi:hypothetical protein